MGGALPPGIEHFPPWAQMVLTVGGFIIAVIIYGKSLLKPTSTDVAKRDVIVPNVNVMDGEAIRQAAEQLRASSRSQEARDIQVREMQRELISHSDIMREQRDIMRENANALRSLHDVLENIDRRLRQELRRQADEAGR